MNKRVVGWKIWYADGLTFDSNESEFMQAPDDGVICIFTYLEGHASRVDNRRYLYAGKDWYFSDGDQLFGCNNDLIEANQKRYPACTFLRGMWIAQDRYDEIIQAAYNDERPKL